MAVQRSGATESTSIHQETRVVRRQIVSPVDDSLGKAGSMRRRTRRPGVVIGAVDVPALLRFYGDIGWTVDGDVVDTPGGRFGVAPEAQPPRLELALSVPDALHVDELLAVVDGAGGIVMEPPQETVWGGWGFSFNDPAANTWEIGAPWSVTAGDLFLSRGVRPERRGPIVALAVPRRV
jgi:predicted enzyme related to lactoylglutathione lyase